MTIEVELVGARRDKVGYVNRRVSRKKRSNNSSKRSLTSKRAKRRDEPMALQRLYDSCRHVFKGPGTVPLPSDVQKLRHILDGMLPEDVGLSRELQFFKPSSAVKGVQRVTYTTIYKCENFSLSIFFLPANAVIPLHNHPEMTVFSKLLLGTMHIKAYDWVDPINLDDSRPPSKLRLARLKANSAFTAPCDTSVLYPTSGGNIHACRAITPCAFLDVMGPPYSKEDGRDCSYYKEYPHTAFSETSYLFRNSKLQVVQLQWIKSKEQTEKKRHKECLPHIHLSVNFAIFCYEPIKSLYLLHLPHLPPSNAGRGMILALFVF